MGQNNNQKIRIVAWLLDLDCKIWNGSAEVLNEIQFWVHTDQNGFIQ